MLMLDFCCMLLITEALQGQTLKDLERDWNQAVQEMQLSEDKL